MPSAIPPHCQESPPHKTGAFYIAEAEDLELAESGFTNSFERNIDARRAVSIGDLQRFKLYLPTFTKDYHQPLKRLFIR